MMSDLSYIDWLQVIPEYLGRYRGEWAIDVYIGAAQQGSQE